MVIAGVLSALGAIPLARAQLSPTASWSSAETDESYSVAWGDLDGDGDLDLAVGNFARQPNRVYRNDGGVLVASWSSDQMDDTTGVAWGDSDGDGDLDLAVGNFNNQRNRLYRNDSGILVLAWSSTEDDYTHGLAWGDWDMDGDLDLAVASSGVPPLDQDRLYRNDGGALTLAWSSDEREATHSLSWGDWDGNGFPELATGTASWPDPQPNRVYAYDGAGGLTLVWTSLETDKTHSVAWADLDGDDDLDLAAGNHNAPGGAQNHLYRNDGGALTVAWTSAEGDFTSTVAWGDWDRDGDPDLAVGNRGALPNPVYPNRVYRNDGGTLQVAWCSNERDSTWSLAWGDVDGDGDLDLAAGNAAGQPNRLYLNDQPPCFVDGLIAHTDLKGVKDGTDGATFTWRADPGAREYHLNSVTSKVDLVPPGPYRATVAGGVGRGQCDAFVPDTVCTDGDALTGAAPLLFYQVLSACGPCGELEGSLR